MSSSSDTPFQVVAEPDVETFVIDHAFRLVHRGVGSFSHSLPDGLYKFKFRRGDAVHEQLIEIGEDTPSPILPPPDFALRPLAVRTASAAPAVFKGVGSSVFIFGELPPDGTRNPLAGVTLHDINGQLLADVAHFQASTECRISVTPGVYRLRCQPPDDDAVELALFASAGWQTRVHLRYPADDVQPLAAFANASIAMTDDNFPADEMQLRLAESALAAMRDKRVTLPRAMIQRLLNEKAGNPMLGIYAAHALLTNDLDDELLPAVIDRIDELVPGHPDAAALRLSRRTGAPLDIEDPPMLRASWSRIIDASLEGKARLVPGSLAARIPASLLDATPWLMWAPEELLETERAVVRDVTNTLRSVTSAVAQNTEAQFSGLESIDIEPLTGALTPDEEELYSLLTRMSRLDQQRQEKRGAAREPLDDKWLAHKLGTTVPRLQAALDGLSAKLRGTKESP